MNLKSLTSYVGLIAGVIILVNILSDKYFVRLDITNDHRYTLSNSTKDILKDLKEPVTVKAYFSENLPPEIAKTRRDFKELLVEYANVSHGKLVYEFIDPSNKEEAERDAQQNGIQPVMINVREKDEVKQQKAYLGAVIRMGGQTDAIPFMKPGAAMEYALTTSIKKVSIKEKPVIGYIQGQGEPSFKAIQQIYNQLSILYTLEEVKLTGLQTELEKLSSLLILAPVDTFQQNQLQELDNYFNNGGRILIAYSRVAGDLQTVSGKSVHTGLEDWLSKKGLTLENSFIIDANCARVGVEQRQSFFSFTSQIPFPYMPIITDFEPHPITKGLQEVMMPFVCPMIYTGTAGLTFTPLARSSKKSGTVPSPVSRFEVNKEWTTKDFNSPNLIVAGILSGKLSGSRESRIVVISDGAFVINGEGRQPQQMQPDNINFMSNSIDWLSDDTGLIELRSKEINSRPLAQIDDAKKILLKYFNFLFPIILIVGYGIYRMQNNRNRRIKRMEPGNI